MNKIQQMICFINSRCSNKIIASLGTKRKISSTFLKIQSEIKKFSKFSWWLLQLTVFVLVFVTQKSPNSLHVFICGMIFASDSCGYQCKRSVLWYCSQQPFLRRNLALQCRLSTWVENVFIITTIDKILI